MKIILVPTDYSETANNALRYAVELAIFSHAKITLLHAYHVPVQTTEIPIVLVSPQELEMENMERIKQLEKEIISKTSGKVKIVSIVRAGFATDEIRNVAQETHADLIVMGIAGAGKVAQALIGSNTTSVMKKTQIPVLVIPKEARYREIKKIVLACNYNEPVDMAAINKIKAFVKLFNVKLLVVDLEKPVATPIYENAIAGETLEKAFNNIEHVLFYSSSEDIAEGINAFVGDHNCDWLAMVPHKRSVLGEFFHKSNTKKMAFHTHIPLLSIHE